MKDVLFALIKPLSFLPAILMMYLIFSFSSQSGVDSGALSYKASCIIVDYGSHFGGRDLNSDEIDYYARQIEYYVRKGAHMTEYFILAICVSFPLYVYGVRGIWLMLLAGIICVGFAAGDEYHQSFVEGRGPSIRDVCIDSVGVFAGIIIVRIFCWILLTPSRIIHFFRGDEDDDE